jgi:murein DD-endopeptidase MepM/ murein hydrolase activator NlpD
MPIVENSRYLVQRGDSLSDIASRISNRSIPLWPAVDRIFEANTKAFIADDMNRLKAGTWLHIPDLSSDAPEPMIAEAAPTETIATANESANFSAYPGYEPEVSEEELSVIEDAIPEPVVTQASEIEEPVSSDTIKTESVFELQQQDDVVSDSAGGIAAPIGVALDETTSIDIPDTEIIEPGLQQVPIVSTGQDNETAGATSGSWSWLVWLGGTGLALILGLLLFGQRIKARFGSKAIGAASRTRPDRRQTDVSAIAEEVEDDVVFEDLETSPQSASLMLDADFGDGSGLQDGTDMDVAQDFGFSTAAIQEVLDTEIPEGADAEQPAEHTEMIPTIRREASILESEVLPTDEDDYDMSVIVDVTKQDVVESDATEKDLQAIEVKPESETMQEDLTLSHASDYKILEQDYEDEFTATQVLNAEIEKAAAELANRMDIETTGEVIATLPENISAVNDDIDDSSSDLELTAELAGAHDDSTAELSTTDEETTIGLEVDLAEIEITQKKKAS